MALISINDVPVRMQPNYSGNDRGIHVAVVDPFKYKVKMARIFDSFKSWDMFEHFISQNIPRGYIIIAAIKDEKSNGIANNIKTFFSSMGSKCMWSLTFDTAFAFIGKIGEGTATEMKALNPGDVAYCAQIF